MKYTTEDGKTFEGPDENDELELSYENDDSWFLTYLTKNDVENLLKMFETN